VQFHAYRFCLRNEIVPQQIPLEKPPAHYGPFIFYIVLIFSKANIFAPFSQKLLSGCYKLPSLLDSSTAKKGSGNLENIHAAIPFLVLYGWQEIPKEGDYVCDFSPRPKLMTDHLDRNDK